METECVLYQNGRRFVSKWEAFCGKTRFVLPPRKYPMIIRDANEIDVSFYLQCLMNIWHMCQFFSAKVRKLEFARISISEILLAINTHQAVVAHSAIFIIHECVP